MKDAGDVGCGLMEEGQDVHTGLSGKTGSETLEPVHESDAKVANQHT